MSDEPRVTVCHYKIWDIISGDWVFSKEKSTAERISRVNGEIVSASCEQVPLADIDDEGRYTPRNKIDRN